ncbi:unnamed protein product [Scytosiphon promiscuus]
MGSAGEGRGVGASHASSVFAARSPAEARAALAAAGLTPMTSASSGGLETLTLQRHMQAQMSMQQSMLSACNDQATNFGQRPAWCGGGGGNGGGARRGAGAALAFGSAGGGGGAGLSGASAHLSNGNGAVSAASAAVTETAGGGHGSRGDGSEPGNGGDSGGAGPGGKDQRLDALPLHHGDAGDPSAMMGLLQQDDMFDFSMLDRDGELKSGDAPSGVAVAARPPGDEHAGMFSFLME